MSYISLYSIPEMDSNYNNAPFFDSSENQHLWIHGHGHLKTTVDANIHVDEVRTTLTIDKSYKEVEADGIDYISLVDDNKRRLYYFVLEYEYKTANATTLILKLDVLQTYMFDITYMNSFVDRCHVDRFNADGTPAGGVADEGLEFGDMVMTNISSEKFRDKYIIASTTPLGKNDWQRPAGGGGDVHPTPTDGRLLEAWTTIVKGI